MKIIWPLLYLSLFSTPHFAQAKDPDYTHREAFPANITLNVLKRGDYFKDSARTPEKTVVKRLASEKIGKDLYRQVHLIIFTKDSGEKVSAIAVNEVSSTECSLTDADVYLISKNFEREK